MTEIYEIKDKMGSKITKQKDPHLDHQNENQQNSQDNIQFAQFSEENDKFEEQKNQDKEKISTGNTLASIIDEIGIKKYQVILYISLSVFWVADGGEQMILSFVNPVIKNQWNLGKEINYVYSFVFLGFLLGSASSGKITNCLGRRKTIIWAIGFKIVFSIVSALAQNLWQYIVTRLMYSFFLGLTIAPAVSTITECTPQKHRGIVNVIFVGFPFIIGEFLAAGVAELTLAEQGNQNWRVMLAFMVIPMGLAFISNLVYLDESPRLLMIKGKFNLGYEVLKKMAKVNGQKELLEKLEDEEVKRQVKEDMEQTRAKLENQEFASFSQLLSDQYRRITLIIWLGWFANTFVYYGIMFWTNQTLIALHGEKQTSKRDIGEIFLVILVELPTPFIAAWVIETRLGRQYTLVLGFLLTGMAIFPVVFVKENGFIICISIAKFLISITFDTSYVITSEIYDSKNRVNGIGCGSMMSRISGILLPAVCNYFTKFSIWTVYLAFAILVTLAGVAHIFLPYDTKNRKLDDTPPEPRKSQKPKLTDQPSEEQLKKLEMMNVRAFDGIEQK